jgi:hypothetical protein
MCHSGTRVFKGIAADDVIGTATFLSVRHLSRQNSFELRFGHAGPRKDTATLFRWVRGHNRCRIDTPIATRLEQERDIQNNKGRIPVTF